MHISVLMDSLNSDRINKTSEKDFYVDELVERIHNEGDFVRIASSISLEWYAFLREKEKFWYKGEMLR